jgi:exonuclease III
MRVLTWNVAGRASRQAEQAAAVAAVGADLVALQEVTKRTLPAWLAALEAAGYGHHADTVDLAPPERRRPLGVLTAAREPLHVETPPEVPWPERVLVTAHGRVQLVNLHSPIAPAPELAKVRTHEAVAAWLSGHPHTPRILCGDLNTPRREHADGSVLTFAHASSGRLRPERGERWDAAERALVHTLRAEHDWVDAYRELHGYGHREASWTFQNDRGGWRLDHVLVHGLTPKAALYLHDLRRAGLSDHSPLLVDLS